MPLSTPESRPIATSARRSLQTSSAIGTPKTERFDALGVGRRPRRRASGAAESHRRALPEPDVNLSAHPAPSIQPCSNGFALVTRLLPSPVGRLPRQDTAVPSVQFHYRTVSPVGSEEARSVAFALTSVRRSNGTCGFPAFRFHGWACAAWSEGISETRPTSLRE